MSIARFIDHTRLKPETTVAEIKQLCAEAQQFGFATVCVNSCYVAFAREFLEDSEVGVCAVVGFPLGAMVTGAKVKEAELAVAGGAGEIDMVMNIGFFKSGNYRMVLDDIRGVVTAVAPRVVKVIIETCLLTDEEKRRAVELVIAGGAGFVKTSTGFGPGGATVEDVRFLSEVAQGRVKVKAAGGIRNLNQAKELLAAGASRLGTSVGVAIVSEFLQLNK